MSDPIATALMAARFQLLTKYKFIGIVSLNFDLTPVTWCNTACTDGERIYYNRDFIASLSKDEVLFVLAHEVVHVIMDHVGRTNGRNRKVWNNAIDYATNALLVNDGIGKMPKNVVYSDKYKDEEWYAERIYDDLMQNSTTVKIPHADHLEEASSNIEGEIEAVVMGDGNGPPKLTADDIERIQKSVQRAISEAASQCSAGDVPLGLQHFIKKIEEPIVDWKSLIHQHVSSQKKDGYSYSRYNKKSQRGGFLLPGKKPAQKVECTVAFDLSGSMNFDLIEEVRGIMDTFGDYDLHVWTFDTEVYGHVTYSPYNRDTFDQYVPHGGGGTDFMANYRYMEEIGHVPKKFIMFTDGLPFGSWGIPTLCDTLFVIVDNPSITAPFGQTVHYSTANKTVA